MVEFGEPIQGVSVKDITDVLFKSRTALHVYSYSGCAAIVIDRQTDKPYVSGKYVVIPAYRTLGQSALHTLYHLRRMSQPKLNPMSLEPDQAILVNRAQCADALTYCSAVAYELLRSRITCLSSALSHTTASSVFRAYEIRASEDFRTINNGLAWYTAYNKCFDEVCTRTEDARLVKDILANNSYMMRCISVEDAKIPPNYFQRLLTMPCGGTYFDMKGRKPWDAMYSAMEYRPNANFLWFIKFERSFNERMVPITAPRPSADIIVLERKKE